MVGRASVILISAHSTVASKKRLSTTTWDASTSANLDLRRKLVRAVTG